VRVLVVDSDLRRPGQHQIFDVPGESGLAEYLIGEKATDDLVFATRVPNVFLIPAGSGGNARHALPMLSSPRMTGLIRTVAKQFDVVLYDTPPVLGVSEASSLAREIGATLLVIQHRRYPRHMVNRARQVLDQSGTRLLGVVVNNVAPSSTETYFYYHHQNDEYLNAPETRAQASRPAATAPTGKPTSSPDDEIQLTGKY
jgi:capsular exopolysaccharide synthesis family protein